jgi:hypothetical protein
MGRYLDIVRKHQIPEGQIRSSATPAPSTDRDPLWESMKRLEAAGLFFF